MTKETKAGTSGSENISYNLPIVPQALRLQRHRSLSDALSLSKMMIACFLEKSFARGVVKKACITYPRQNLFDSLCRRLFTFGFDSKAVMVSDCGRCTTNLAMGLLRVIGSILSNTSKSVTKRKTLMFFEFVERLLRQPFSQL